MIVFVDEAPGTASISSWVEMEYVPLATWTVTGPVTPLLASSVAAFCTVAQGLFADPSPVVSLPLVAT